MVHVMLAGRSPWPLFFVAIPTTLPGCLVSCLPPFKGNGYTFRLFACTPNPFEKGVYSISKEFTPAESKFFPYKADLLSEEDKTISHLKFVSIPIKCLSISEVGGEDK